MEKGKEKQKEKKNKRKTRETETQDSGSKASASDKRTKTSSPQGSPPPPSTIPIRYQDMPSNHKRKFFIYDDCGVLHKYIELISWLRTMGCFFGTVFSGIENLNCFPEHGYPLVEIEVVTPQDRSAKFLISKNTLYLIAWLARSGNLQYSKCEFLVSDTYRLPDYDGSYADDLWKDLHKPWVHLGPKAMIDAVNVLDTPAVLTNGSLEDIVRASQVFAVHLCEAARLYVVQFFICRTLSPLHNHPPPKLTYENEGNMLLQGENGQVITPDNDVYALVTSDSINFDNILATPDLIGNILHKYSLLSKIWMVYALTGFCPMTESQVSTYRVRSVKSLRSILAVLCNINCDKILKEWRKKCKTHPRITSQVFNQMEKRIRDLQSEKRIRTT